ncbi:RNA polymerase sigma factor SigM [Actinomadura fibrosa]|uniref:RNA polymerase sigma factor SigM n=1 Tax=Actinomadura fibrosa TaxID=111802 RepID=A0ABW2XQ78_9ACTN|nr:RNA polymerase sigma factor SigM [Actinomadura fibrosa]
MLTISQTVGDDDDLVGVNDKELLAKHARGHPDAFAELVKRHRSRMWAVANRTMGDPEEAAEALQEALLQVFRAAPRFRGDGAVTTWLHRIVVNACMDRLRRQSVRPAVPVGDDILEAIAAPDVADAHDVSLDITEVLEVLPFGQRAALVLVDMMGYTVHEAAQVLDVPPGTIKSRCQRGRSRLAILLKHYTPRQQSATSA